MRAREFLSRLSNDEIVAAIREAESKTSGEIRVFISRKQIDDPLATAQARFVEMGMKNTRDRNGVLIFVAPRVHKFAIVGDSAVHARCGEEFWNQLAAEIAGHFKGSDFTRGIVYGVRKAGQLLAKYFPRRPDDVNELPDQVMGE
jgi:uncharacterized membrane protein